MGRLGRWVDIHLLNMLALQVTSDIRVGGCCNSSCEQDHHKRGSDNRGIHITTNACTNCLLCYCTTTCHSIDSPLFVWVYVHT